jgi:hypothetical protein
MDCDVSLQYLEFRDLKECRRRQIERRSDPHKTFQRNGSLAGFNMRNKSLIETGTLGEVTLFPTLILSKLLDPSPHPFARNFCNRCNLRSFATPSIFAWQVLSIGDSERLRLTTSVPFVPVGEQGWVQRIEDTSLIGTVAV